MSAVKNEKIKESSGVVIIPKRPDVAQWALALLGLIDPRVQGSVLVTQSRGCA